MTKDSQHPLPKTGARAPVTVEQHVAAKEQERTRQSHEAFESAISLAAVHSDGTTTLRRFKEFFGV